MFSQRQPRKPFSHAVTKLVKKPDDIDQDAAKSILVESFIGEYSKYLLPEEIDSSLVSWRSGEHSVQKYYENYFASEFKEFSEGHLHYWVEARVNGKLAGFATFEHEHAEENAVYMNLLVVLPEYQGKGIGKQLVMSLLDQKIIPELSAIHLLLRQKNQGGRIFYSKLGFYEDPSYQRPDNYVDMNLLEALTWKNPALENKEIVRQITTARPM